MRRPDRCEKQFPAHSGPVFSVNWHPEDKNWFATAGRDKMIKVRYLWMIVALNVLFNDLICTEN